MTVKLTKYNIMPKAEAQFTRSGTELTATAMGLFKEGLEADKVNGSIFKEQFSKILKEDVNTTTANGAYTTMLASIMQTAVIEDADLKEAESLVFINRDLVGKVSYGAMKIPILAITSAVEVAEGATTGYSDKGVSHLTVTAKKYVFSTKMTWEIKKRGMDGMTKWILIQARDAIVRKRISNIVNGLAAAAGFTVSGGFSYANFVAARKAVRGAKDGAGEAFNFHPNSLVVSDDAYADMLLDTDFKSAMYPANANPNIKFGSMGIIGPMKVIDCVIWETPLLSGALALVHEKGKNMLIQESDLEFFDGRLPKSVDTEILGVESSVMAAIRPTAIAKITT